MEKRKEELEKKRQKLAQLRKQREERKKNFVAAQRVLSAETSLEIERSSIDELVTSLVGDREDSSHERKLSNVSQQLNDFSMSETNKEQVQNTFPVIKEKTELQRAHFEIFELFPVEKVVYSKEVQTTMDDFVDLAEEKETNSVEIETAENSETEDKPVEPKVLYEVLGNDEMLEFFKTPELIGFVKNSTKVVERALNQECYDYMIDYTKSEPKKNETSDETMKRIITFKSTLCEHRSVMDIDWSIKYEELLLTCYNKDSAPLNTADGLVCVWNLHLKDRPEFMFQAQSDVLCAKFAKYHPNLIIGGTYTGQVVLWDTRASQIPVLKSQLTVDGHTHPIHSIEVVGTQNSHNYITTSSDGTVCSWEIGMLANPVESIHLAHPDHSKSDELTVTSVGFSSSEHTAFWVGTEEGHIYQANRLDRVGGKTGVNPYDVYTGHNGPTSSISFHPVDEKDPLDFGELFLSSSFDWKVKLWQTKNLQKPSNVKTKIHPIHSFESRANAAVYWVEWAPQHPAAFGLIDGHNNFDIWNLNQNTEFPVANAQITKDLEHGLTKFKFNSKGTHAAIGASNGETYIYDLGNIIKPSPDDWLKFRNVITEFTGN